MKYIIFDAGPIISLTMNGLLPVLEKLKKEFNGEFILTPAVKKEVIDKPLKIKKYKLEALQVNELLRKGVFTPSSKVIPNQKLHKESSTILKKVNNLFKSSRTGERIKLLHNGEASCMAFSNLCGCDSVIVIDERATRILIEAPENLKGLLSRKLGSDVIEVGSQGDNLRNHKFIRSAELMYLAYKKGLLQEKTKEFLDAVLFALKFKGTAISSGEIEEIKKMAVL
jgi:predicted nucleic acid-binding protein